MIGNETIKGTIVLAHAAWFDGSSWNKVTSRLQGKGYEVVAAQLPLTSLRNDEAALRGILKRIQGPVLVVGHSYGGAVITAAGAGSTNVKGLVYIAAIVPDENETVGAVFTRVAPHPKAPQLQPDENGLLWVNQQAFQEAISPDASPEENALLAASQKPISLNCLGEPMRKPAWKEKPSWFLIAEKDRMLSPDTQHFLAKRMDSKTESADTDHAPLISNPDTVAKLIEEAAARVIA